MMITGCTDGEPHGCTYSNPDGFTHGELLALISLFV